MRALFPLLAIPFVAGAQPQDPSWHTWTPDDSSFSVVLPATPAVSQFHSLTTKGTLPTRTLTVTGQRRAEFMLSWTEYPSASSQPKPTPETFAKARDALLADGDAGEILADEVESVPGQTGHRITLRKPSGRIQQVRFVMHRHRFYQIQAETEDTPAARESGRRFLDSFVPSGMVRI